MRSRSAPTRMPRPGSCTASAMASWRACRAGKYTPSDTTYPTFADELRGGLGPLVQRWVVCADDQQVRVLTLIQLGEASMIVQHCFSIERQEGLHHRQPSRNRRPVERAVVIERIAGVQHPAVAGIDGDAGVAA